MNIGQRGSAYGPGQRQRTGMNGGAADGWERAASAGGADTNIGWTAVPSERNQGFAKVQNHGAHNAVWRKPPARNASGALHGIVKNVNVQAAKAAAQRMADRIRPKPAPPRMQPVNLPGVAQALPYVGALPGTGPQETYAPPVQPPQMPMQTRGIGYLPPMAPRRPMPTYLPATHGAGLVNPVAPPGVRPAPLSGIDVRLSQNLRDAGSQALAQRAAAQRAALVQRVLLSGRA